MSAFSLTIYILKFFIPALFSVLFRAFGLGYKSKKSLIIGLTVFVIYMATVPTFFILVTGYGQFTHLSTIIMTIASLSVLIFTTDGVAKTMFLQLTQGCMTTALSVVLNLIRTVFHLSYPVLVLMLAIASPILYWFAMRYWAKPMRFMADHIHAELPTMVTLPILTMVVVYFLPVYPAQSFANHPVYVTFMMLVVECGYMLYVYTFYRNLRKLSELSSIQLKSQRLETEISSYQDYLEAAKQSRHDMRHHNAVLLEYLKNGDTDQAIDYLNLSNTRLSNTALKQFCENSTANAVLRIYDRRLQEMEIPFSVQAEIPTDLPLDAMELGALLSNLLENATEACAKLPSAQRYVSLVTQKDEYNWQLEMRNSVCGKVIFENKLPRTTKPLGGTGTRSIAQIVEAHAGMLRFQQQDDVFLVQIVLPMQN